MRRLYGRLTSSILYASASLRAEPGVIAGNRRSQSGLWGYAISGDLPIVLLQIKSPDNIELVRQLVQAHAYWRLKGLKVDLVIWNEERGGYRQVLHDQIMGLVAAGVEANVIDRPGGIFVRAADQISVEDRTLLQSVARAIFTDSRGTLADQVRRRAPVEPAIPRLAVSEERVSSSASPVTSARPDLVMDNGLGGFSADGREYVIITTEGQVTPAPWVNVVANPYFGCLISENGPVYTWHENAHEFRLTPWHNDPVTDASGEAFFLRDEASGRFWSPSPLPRRGEGSYTCRHGFGYSVFEHAEDGIVTELTVYVALDTAVKFTRLEGAQCIGARAATLRDRLRGMGAGGPATENHHACGHRDRSGERRGVRPQRLPSGVRRQRRLPGRGRHGPHHQRRPHGVHRTQRLAAQPGGACASAPLGQSGCGHGSLHGHSDSVRARGRAIARDHLSHGRGSRSRGRQSAGAASTASPAPRAQRSRR